MNNPQRSFFYNVDWISVFIYVCLCTIGWFNIHSAAFDPHHPGIFSTDTDYGKQLIYLCVAVTGEPVNYSTGGAILCDHHFSVDPGFSNRPKCGR
jgi:hypothetical protein